MSLQDLLDNNLKWSDKIRAAEPDFFETLAKQQAPEYLWIGCADSRVPANEIVGLRPGEIFVHRNVANLVLQTDFNCLSVVQYAVDVLRVKHIILTGHYGCGGVKAALHRSELGLIDNWLYAIRMIVEKHRDYLDSIPDETAKLDVLCELNVIEQVRQLCVNSLIKRAWQRGQELKVHGCVYGLNKGILHDLKATTGSEEEIETSYHTALLFLKDRDPKNRF
jgi:carbonic anhydrase